MPMCHPRERGGPEASRTLARLSTTVCVERIEAAPVRLKLDSRVRGNDREFREAPPLNKKAPGGAFFSNRARRDLT